MLLRLLRDLKIRNLTAPGHPVGKPHYPVPQRKELRGGMRPATAGNDPVHFLRLDDALSSHPLSPTDHTSPAQKTPAKDSCQVNALAKSFDDIRAVAGVDFDVRQGELFGFLGPNGAGKTTTITMLTGLARPDSGTIRIAGIDCSRNPKGAQHLMGIVADECNLYPELTGFENLCFCGALYGMAKRDRIKRSLELLDRFGLAQAAGRKFAGYSRGMKRKLTIAAGIIHKPAILFLDEPTTGIDVASARQIRQLIAELNTGGTTVFLTTHYIEEAERLCRRIAFIVKGRIVRTDRVENLMRQTDGQHVVRFTVSGAASELSDRLAAEFPRLRCRAVAEGGIRVESTEPVRVGPLVRLLEDQGGCVSEERIIRPSLEDVFVRVTGIEAGSMKQEQEKEMGGEHVKTWIAFWNILAKDMRTYYLKPPNISWGLLFPLVWVAMFFIRSEPGLESLPTLLPGLMALSILFGTTSVHSVTVTFEKKGRSFERLLLAPISLEVLMLAKTAGAIFFGTVNAIVPLLLASLLTDLSDVRWELLAPAAVLLSISSTFLGLFIAVSVKEVFEAQTFSNFFRFPMIFLSGLFYPVEQLPAWLRPVSYVLPLTYGTDILRTSVNRAGHMPLTISFFLLAASCVLLFSLSLRNVRRKWIA